MEILRETNLPNLYHRGKVRDTYDMGSDMLLIIATDRVSAFDVVLPNGIPDKGIVLNQLSAFWFDKTAHIVPNHMLEVVNDVNWLNRVYGERVCVSYYSYPPYVERRSMIVKKAERIDIECVVRGYLSGSAWAEYKQGGTISGITMPKGLKESEKLPEPMFTPTTKESAGHDQPITVKQMEKLLGKSLTVEIIEKSLAIYDYAAEYARTRGIIIADTKMEFGMIEGKLSLIDELLTPDSSRFWDAEKYSPGKSQPSFDKQMLRDWLTDSGWNKEPPAPELPPKVVKETSKRYREAYRRLTGHEL
ncbi:MAG TPA: phosphoribosylaminoimidazolesuccinocarboxamide synthase [Dehalococcoidia bacterium]|nr:phosphoribosylaminoimidazolesuccinocarboxamide synthase [Dehalococcoidia bacterium]